MSVQQLRFKELGLLHDLLVCDKIIALIRYIRSETVFDNVPLRRCKAVVRDAMPGAFCARDGLGDSEMFPKKGKKSHSVL